MSLQAIPSRPSVFRWSPPRLVHDRNPFFLLSPLCLTLTPCRPGTVASCGSTQVTVVPRPTAESRRTVPPNAATACLTMANPRPVPRPAVPLRAGSTW